MDLTQKTPEQVNQMSPLIWAYMGDAIYEMEVRKYLINTTNKKPHELHLETIEYVKALSQAKIVEYLKENSILNEAEQDILRRGRNTQNYHTPKNVNPMQYSYATAFEALIGYLYLTGNIDRTNQIIRISIDYINSQKNNKM